MQLDTDEVGKDVAFMIKTDPDLKHSNPLEVLETFQQHSTPQNLES